MWELLILIIVIAGVHWWEYSTSVQEYTFAQPATLDRHSELGRVLQEKTPIAVEIGGLPWRPDVASNAAWSVSTDQGMTTITDWLANRAPITDTESLAKTMELTTGLADLDEGRPWWWLPELRNSQANILESEEFQGLQWVAAERHWVGCSHGGPITIWIVHSRYRKYLPNTRGSAIVNPWKLTVAEAPWIGRVQYIEVTIKPGWCIGIPAHWGYAVRADVESWIWSADQHSLFSFALTHPSLSGKLTEGGSVINTLLTLVVDGITVLGDGVTHVLDQLSS